MQSKVVQPPEWERRAIQQRLKELLASGGQNDDCHIIDSDSGTYEQKVLMFQNVVDDELFQAVSKMLKDYSEDWSVLFLDTDENGTEVPFGIRVNSIFFQLIRPPPTPKELVDWKTTEDLFDKLVPLFAAHGTQYKEYWLWDDKWVPLSHRIHINDIEYLTPCLVDEVQQVLKNGFPTCVLWMQIDAEAPGVDVPCEGIRVHSDRIEEDWDRDKLRAIFKDKFKW